MMAKMKSNGKNMRKSLGKPSLTKSMVKVANHDEKKDTGKNKLSNKSKKNDHNSTDDDENNIDEIETLREIEERIVGVSRFNDEDDSADDELLSEDEYDEEGEEVDEDVSDGDEDEAEEEPFEFPENPTHDILDFDLHNLCVTDPRPVKGLISDPKTTEEKVRNEAILHRISEANTQLLIEQLFALPKSEETDRVVILPSANVPLPRAKPAPKPKPETRWEKFSKERGIKKRKRDRMVWDEATQSWKPRFGYGRANDETKVPIVELKPDDDPTVDHLAALKEAKKMRVLKGEKNRLRNIAIQEEKSGKLIPSGISNDLGATRGKGRGRDRTEKALKFAQISSASMGKFDTRMKGEAAPQRGDKKRRFAPNHQGKNGISNLEKESDKRILSRVLKGGIISTSSNRAISDVDMDSTKRSRKKFKR